jgi:hypothetical protein
MPKMKDARGRWASGGGGSSKASGGGKTTAQKTAAMVKKNYANIAKSGHPSGVRMSKFSRRTAVAQSLTNFRNFK